MNISELYQIYLQYPEINYDTRKIVNGGIFICLKGDRDGNAFAYEALEKGADYVIADSKALPAHDKIIVVQDVLTTLQELATYHRQQFDIPFLAITGSNGKTTTKELINAVMKQQYITYCTAGNLNNHIGVPLTLLSIKKDAQFAIIEMGANHQKEIASYCPWAMPTHVLINNCGEAHLEGFGGIEGVRKGKGELYDYAKANDCIVFCNYDLEYLVQMVQSRTINKEKIISYGSTNCNYNGRIAANDECLHVALLNSGMETVIHSNLVGDYNFANIMAAVAVGSTFNINIDTIKKGIEEYIPSNSRSQLIIQGSNKIILDAYNANPTSMEAAIKNFAGADYPNKVLLLGAMKEMGPHELEKHQALVDLCEQWNWNAVVLVGYEFDNVSHNYLHFQDSLQAREWLQAQAFENTAMLVKGSNGSKMEKVLA
jgi:UDP-N-acetylmuramoyl-tripeptide--D-alanyl-D-alanine ligase